MNKPPFGFNLTITLGMVLNLMDSILEEYGNDHVNPPGQCQYAENNSGALKPLCIVGVMFHNLGILRTLVGSYDANPDVFVGALTIGSYMNNACSINADGRLRNYLEAAHTIFMTDDAYSFLKLVQASQDGTETWGDAVEYASRSILTSRGEPTTQFQLLKIHEEVSG